MVSTWQAESGRLACNWSDGDQICYRPLWMQEGSIASGSHLPPILDFSSHSPFGGAFWFEPIQQRGQSEQNLW